MDKKILIVGLLLFVMLLLPINSAYSNIGIHVDKNSIILFNRGNTLYVGGNGTGNYSKIQDALDFTNNGDTVFVYDDSSPYNEWNIRINKSINLIGEDKNTTVIDGSGHSIIYPEVTGIITGFSIINGICGIISGRYMENIIITDNHFVNCAIGIELHSNSDSYIISNSFKNFYIAINSNSFGGCTISDNILISSGDIYYQPSGDITLVDNGKYVITNNTLICNDIGEYRKGIYLSNISDCIIERNEFNGYINSNAIYLWRGSCNNIITHNNFSNNRDGIGVVQKSNSNKITNNNFINNKRDVFIRYIDTKNNLLDGNYWDKWIGNKIKIPLFQKFPHVAFSLFGFAIDWHPAKEPYDI
ncbi:hypothetical protein AYK24_09985 [Thermoplasmatales archaeon SG8-52-4]|nr:MAG: hypothetical protein AYK24_09985 [Thermoplasmatales archaeon SG8-52-4]